MDYLDSLVNQLFKKSGESKPLFYPWGIFGKGYEVSSASEESRIRSVLKVYYVVLFVAMGFCIYVLDWVYAAGCAIVGIGGYSVWSGAVTRRLTASRESLKFSESLDQGLPYYSTWVLVVLSLSSFLLFLASALMLYTDPSEWMMGLLGTVLFGASTAMLVNMTRRKLSSKRP